MPKCLVVYYSRTGHTEQVANALADALGADVERIREAKNRHGFWGYFWSGYETLTGKLPEIARLAHDPARYDTVVLGSPVWASRPATPMRSFIAANRDSLKQIACFVTLGGSGARKTMERMAEAAGREALATFAVTEPELAAGNWKPGLARFAQAIAGKD